MRKNYKSFKFNGDSASFSDVLNVTLDNDFYEECIRGDREILTEQIPGRDIPYFYEVDDLPLEFDLHFAFQIPVSKDRIKDITRKLLGPRTYKELTFGEYESGTYVAKTPIYNAIFKGSTDFSYVQQGGIVNNLEDQVDGTISKIDYTRTLATYSVTKTNLSWPVTYNSAATGSLLDDSDTITGITNFTDLRVGQYVSNGATQLGQIQELDTTNNEIILDTVNTAGDKTGVFTFTDKKRLTAENVTNLEIGMLLSGSGVPSNTFIDGIYNSTTISVDTELTTTVSGGERSFYKLNTLTINSLTDIERNFKITAGDANLVGKLISSIDTVNSRIVVSPTPTTFAASASATITSDKYPTTSTVLSYVITSGETHYDFKVENTLTVRGENGQFITGTITATGANSVTITPISSYSNYADLVDGDMYVTYIDSDNGFIGYFVLHVLCDRPYGYNDIAAGDIDGSAVSDLTVNNTGDIEFYPDIVIEATSTTSNWIRIVNTTNGSTVTFKGVTDGETITVNSNLKTITSTVSGVYTRWNKDDLYLDTGINYLDVESSSNSGATWSSASIKLEVTGEAPVYVYEAE